MMAEEDMLRKKKSCMKKGCIILSCMIYTVIIFYSIFMQVMKCIYRQFNRYLLLEELHCTCYTINGR